MSRKTHSVLVPLTLALALAACGQGRDDTLADGAVDRPHDGESAASAQDVGPPTPSSAAAGPATGRTGADMGTTAGAPGSGSPAAAGPTLRVQAGAAGQGPHLVDSGGIALYMLEGDRAGEKCTGECLQAWPPVLMGATQPTGETGLAGAMISTTARPDGSRQITFNGHPLYRYADDGGAGSTNGHGVRDRFGTWHLVSPEGGKVAGALAAR